MFRLRPCLCARRRDGNGGGGRKRSTPTSPTGHTHWSRPPSSPRDCPHCPLVREETKEEKGEPEAHSYEATEAGSVLRRSAATPARTARRRSRKRSPSTITTRRRSTDAAHVAVGEKTTTETCASCGAVVAENAQPYSEEMPHTYVDGVCAECGHACSHAGYELPEETFVPTAYASNGADGPYRHPATCTSSSIATCAARSFPTPSPRRA